MIFFRLALAIEKQCGLAEKIKKACAAVPDLSCLYTLRVTCKTTLNCSCLEGAPATQRIWVVACLALVDLVALKAIPLVIVDGYYGPVDWNLVKN